MPQSGYVYIVHGVDTPYIKVGKTTNIAKRLTNLEQGVPFSLQLLYAELVADMDASERLLKQRYASFRTRGEWFELPIEWLQQWPIGNITVKLLKTVTPKVALPERLLQLLALGKALTVRELQRHIKPSNHEMIRTALQALVTDERICMRQIGKRVEYLCIVPSREEAM